MHIRMLCQQALPEHSETKVCGPCGCCCSILISPSSDPACHLSMCTICQPTSMSFHEDGLSINLVSYLPAQRHSLSLRLWLTQVMCNGCAGLQVLDLAAQAEACGAQAQTGRAYKCKQLHNKQHGTKRSQPKVRQQGCRPHKCA